MAAGEGLYHRRTSARPTMRRTLALASALVLAACDSAGPTDADALVGTWALTGLREELRVTSRADQVLPDLTAEAEGAVEVAGAAPARLPFLAFVVASAEDRLAVFYERERSDGDPGAQLLLYQSDFSDEASFYGGADGLAFSADVPEGAALFTSDGAAVTVPPLTLTSEGGLEVVASGTLTFPEIALAAGEPTSLPERSLFELFEDEGITITFREDGTFESRAAGDDLTVGTWESTEDGEVTVRIREGGETETVRFAFRVEGGALTLSLSGPSGDGCDAPCRLGYEAGLLAEPGSLSDVTSTFVYEFAEAADAEAQRPAPEARVRPEVPGRPALPLVGRVR